jgi:protein tyrosine/serine phosphatase
MKKVIIGLFIVLLIPLSEYIYRMHFNYNFEVITDGKVYKSGVIKPSKIKDYILKYHIKTIIDLRKGNIITALNPANESDILKEKRAVEKIEGVKYVHIPSKQVPGKKQLIDFFKVMDNKNNYPVLIHCYHGTGRAMMYSALYRIEYENFTNEEARSKTRFILYKSSFDANREKGKFLINYKKRGNNDATIRSLDDY